MFSLTDTSALLSSGSFSRFLALAVRLYRFGSKTKKSSQNLTERPLTEGSCCYFARQFGNTSLIFVSYVYSVTSGHFVHSERISILTSVRACIFGVSQERSLFCFLEQQTVRQHEFNFRFLCLVQKIIMLAEKYSENVNNYTQIARFV